MNSKIPCQVWMTVEEEKLLREAATVERRPLTQFFLLQALKAAKKIHKKKLDSLPGNR